LNPKEYVL
jgi:hypothetical protein